MVASNDARSDNPFNAQDIFVFATGPKPADFKHVAGQGVGAMAERGHSGPAARRFVRELLTSSGAGTREHEDIVHAFGPYFGRKFAAVECDSRHVLLAGRRDQTALRLPLLGDRLDTETASCWALDLLGDLPPLPPAIPARIAAPQLDESTTWSLPSDEYCVGIATQIREHTAALSQDGAPCDLVLVNHHYRLGVAAADEELINELMCVTSDLGYFLWQSNPLPFPATGHNTDAVDHEILKQAGNAPEICSYALGEHRTGDEFDRVLLANTWDNPRGITGGMVSYARNCATSVSRLERDRTTGLLTDNRQVHELGAEHVGVVLHFESPELVEGSETVAHLMTPFAEAVEAQVTARGGVTVRARTSEEPTRLTAYLPDSDETRCDELREAILTSLEPTGLTVLAAHAALNGDGVREAGYRARFGLRQARAACGLSSVPKNRARRGGAGPFR